MTTSLIKQIIALTIIAFVCCNCNLDSDWDFLLKDGFGEQLPAWPAPSLGDDQPTLAEVDQLGLEASSQESVEKPSKPEPIKSVVVEQIDALPDEFEITKLPGIISRLPSRKEEAKVSFDYLGALNILLNQQPDDPFKIDTQFHVMTRTSKTVIPFKIIRNCVKQETEDNCKHYPLDFNEMLKIFNVNHRTLIIIGGFLTQAPSDWQLKIAEKWLQLEDLNVVIVSWNKGNKFLYPKAVANTKVVARQVVVALYYLARIHNFDPRDPKFTEKIMIVGHSLGAHIAGFIGQDFGGTLGRITGLDPAGPSFSQSHESHRLDRTDALLVDVIHTNADFGFNFFLGLYTPVGHVDYYANNGKWQPHCQYHDLIGCNHGAVTHYYRTILDHELSMRQEHKLAERDNYRIVAYRSNDYDRFRTGASLYEHCPELSDDTDDAFAQTGAVDFWQCAIPIDFIKDAREFRQELEQVHKINMAPDHVSTAKFYFFTSPKQPYVVDHNLLKLHYEFPEDKKFLGIKFARLKMTYTMIDGEKSTSRIPIHGQTLSMDEFDLHPHTSFPFVVTNQFGRYMLIDLETNDYFKSQLAASTDGAADRERLAAVERSIVNHAMKIFPSEIKLDVEGNKRYRFKSARVQPLRHTQRLLMGIYTAHQGIEGADKQSFSPRVVFLKQGEPVPSVPIDYNKPLEDPTLYLNTLVIGPDANMAQEAPSARVFRTRTTPAPVLSPKMSRISRIMATKSRSGGPSSLNMSADEQRSREKTMMLRMIANTRRLIENARF